MTSWWQLLLYCGCFVGAYKAGKYFGFCEGMTFFRKKGIQRNADGHGHYCNITLCNMVCFEREDDLWVKEYCGPDEKEGRTYMVFHCPWCGFQTQKSKLRESNEPRRT